MEKIDWLKMKEKVISYWTEFPEKEGENYVIQLDESITSIQKEVKENLAETYFLKQKQTETPSAFLTKQAHSIFTCTLGYCISQSKYYHSEKLLENIQHMLSKFFKIYNGQEEFGNWWDWQIGIPTWLLPTLILLEENISADLSNYLARLSAYLPNPYEQFYTVKQDSPVLVSSLNRSKSTGANRTDLAYLSFLIALLKEDEKKAEEAVSSTYEVFSYVKKGDGFYQDGSMIQHFSIPYVGAYGIVLIEGIARLYNLIEETSLLLPLFMKDKIGKLIEKSYLPFLHEGEFLMGVKGRSISRENIFHNEYGSTALLDLLYLSDILPEKCQKEIQQAVVPMIKLHEDFYLENIRHGKDITLLAQLKKAVLNVSPKEKRAMVFPSMDRMVYKNNKTTVGLSFYSNRISAFEAGNGENLKGWYTGDGMYQIHQQGDQFLNDYFPTVNYYTLPGTTVDTRPLARESNNFQECLSEENHVGGLKVRDFLVSGMILNKKGTNHSGEDAHLNLTAKKSYFIWEDFLICLGAGITGETFSEKGIVTTIDHRMLAKNNRVTLENNQKEQFLNPGESFYLNDGQSHLGYVSLDGGKFTVVKEKRQGNYGQINKTNDGKHLYEREFLTIQKLHGQKAQNDTYAYAIYVGESEQEFQEKINQLPEIMENSSTAQVLAVKKQLVLGNVYKTYRNESFAFKTPTMFIQEERLDKYILTVCQPKQDGTPLEIEFTGELLAYPVHATVKNKHLQIPTLGDEGKSYEIIVKK